MNPFTIAVIVLFVLAAGWEGINGHAWMSLFYFCSAIINIAAVHLK